MKKKPKVLHVFHGLGMGGAETWIKELVLWDIKVNLFKFEIEILVTGGKEEYWDYTLKLANINIHYIYLGKGNVYSFIKSFRNLLSTNNYIAIHNHQELFSGWHFLFGIGLLPNICISHFHNPFFQMKSNYGNSFVKRVKLILGKHFIYIFSNYIRGTSLDILTKHGFLNWKFNKHQPKPLYCSFDFSKYISHERTNNFRKELDIELNTKIVLVVGRFDYNMIEGHPQNHKNTAFILYVLEKLLYEDLIFVFIGENKHSIEGFYLLASKLKITHKLRVLGLRKDVHILMQESDLLFFPSREEGLGMVAVEAQVANLPVLISDGVPIECKIIDCLVHQLDLRLSKEVWAKKIIELLNYDSQIKGFRTLLNSSDFNIRNSHFLLNKLYSLD